MEGEEALYRESPLMHCFTLNPGDLCRPYSMFVYVCIVYCYLTAGCCLMQGPLCWWAACAPGLCKPSEYLPLQAVISSQSRLKVRCCLRLQREAGSWGSDWLISQSPEVLHSRASSLVSQEPGCYRISTLLKGLLEVGDGPHPHHLRLYTWICLLFCQIVAFCACILKFS